MTARPLILSVLCIFSWIYFGMIALVFLFAAVYSGRITGLAHQYLSERVLTKGLTLGFSLTGFFLHGASFTGVILLWNLRKTGYYFFSIPALLIVFLHLFRSDISWFATALYVLLIIAFGIYYRRMD